MFRLAGLVAAASLLLPNTARAGDLEVGFAAIDITPAINDENPTWIAGYGVGRRATGVHDPLFARCIAIRHGDDMLAFVSVDLIGLQYQAVQAIRQQLPDFLHVTVASTHSHEGPDVIGIWGRSHLHRGVDDQYVERIVQKVVSVVEQAAKSMVAVTADYGTAADETLLRDTREPVVKDGVLRVLHFRRRDNQESAGLVVQWNCHPEAMGPDNTLLTADFPATTITELTRRFDCPVVYFTGAIGGLMTTPHDRMYDPTGKELKEGDFAYAEQYGREVARLAEQAIHASAPIGLTPIQVSVSPVAVRVSNRLYRVARAMGIVTRQGYEWLGDGTRLGGKLGNKQANVISAIQSEVGYVRLGELHLVLIPGELYPELVYGKVQDPADEGADYPDAPIEPAVVDLVPGEKWMMFGLANDEVGYIIPRRQWDRRAPFAYDRRSSQYGEVNSCGPSVAPVIMEALKQRIQAAAKN